MQSSCGDWPSHPSAGGRRGRRTEPAGGSAGPHVLARRPGDGAPERLAHHRAVHRRLGAQHSHTIASAAASKPAYRGSSWWAKGDLNPHPLRGHGPQPCASACSATRPCSRVQAPVSLQPDYTLNRLTVVPRGSARSPDIPSELRFVRSLCPAIPPHSSRGRYVPLANPLSSGRRPGALSAVREAATGAASTRQDAAAPGPHTRGRHPKMQRDRNNTLTVVRQAGKSCPDCGEQRPADAFYQRPDGRLSTYCKVHQCQRSRASYRRRRQDPAKLFRMRDQERVRKRNTRARLSTVDPGREARLRKSRLAAVRRLIAAHPDEYRALLEQERYACHDRSGGGQDVA
jgi:hypothetical protein